MLLTETRAAEQLREEGYTVLRGVLDVEQDIEPLIEEYGVVLDGLIEKLYAEGKLRHKYPAENTLDRLSAFVADTGDEFFDNLSIYVSHSYDSADRPMYLHPQMFNLLRSPTPAGRHRAVHRGRDCSEPPAHHAHQAAGAFSVRGRAELSERHDLEDAVAPGPVGVPDRR